MSPLAPAITTLAAVMVGALAFRPAPTARRVTVPGRHSRQPRSSPVTRITEWRRRARVQAAVLSELPEIIDLFRVATGAGLTVALAVPAVAAHASTGRDRPIAAALAHAADQVRLGGGLADALERVPATLDAATRPLIATLLDATRYGTPIGPSLDRLADEARRDTQRRAEQAARRVPVKLLFPLVCCVLPAFALLTVAPVLASGIRALRP